MLGLAKNCEQCGKKIPDKGVFRAGKYFCCETCMKGYGKTHPSKNPNVCEFC